MQKLKRQFKVQTYFTAALIIFGLLFIITPCFAVELFLNPKIQKIKTGDEFKIDFFINTENENINAIEGKILFPAEFLTLKETRDGNSIINFWIERPNIKYNNRIIFAGIIPGGYLNKKGFIFSMIFQAKKEGADEIEIFNSNALLNDGKGTETNVKTSNFQFLISEQSTIPPLPKLPAKDTEPPEPFKLIIAQDPSIFNNKYFLVFATQDKGSGIDRYEVREGEKIFIIAESPYLLKNQNLDEKIIVKAIDKAGNERIAIISPQKKQSLLYKNYLLFVIILLVIIIVYFTQKIIRNKFIKNDKN